MGTKNILNIISHAAAAAAAAAKSLQSCPTLCDPIEGSPSGSTIPGIFQARTLEWVAISFSHERNANQNHSEIPIPTRMAIIKK